MADSGQIWADLGGADRGYRSFGWRDNHHPSWYVATDRTLDRYRIVNEALV
jgi:hypothetical protein